MAALGRPYPHTYLGLGVIGLRISSAQALFNYTELAHLVTMELSKTLFTSELTDKFIGMELNQTEFTQLV
ncbi:MAG: hypothetical protein V3S69_07570 [Dehalococcoidales bacterium]